MKMMLALYQTKAQIVVMLYSHRSLKQQFTELATSLCSHLITIYHTQWEHDNRYTIDWQIRITWYVFYCPFQSKVKHELQCGKCKILQRRNQPKVSIIRHLKHPRLYGYQGMCNTSIRRYRIYIVEQSSIPGEQCKLTRGSSFVFLVIYTVS